MSQPYWKFVIHLINRLLFLDLSVRVEYRMTRQRREMLKHRNEIQNLLSIPKEILLDSLIEAEIHQLVSANLTVGILVQTSTLGEHNFF